MNLHYTQSLSLAFCYSLTNAGFQAIADNCSTLRRLYMMGCWNVTDEAVNAIIGSSRDMTVQCHTTPLPTIEPNAYTLTHTRASPQLLQMDKCYCISKGGVAAMLKRMEMSLRTRQWYGTAPCSKLVQSYIRRRRAWRTSSVAIQRAWARYSMLKLSWEERVAEAKRISALRDNASTNIQRIARGYLARRYFESVREEFAKNVALRENRARRIMQRMARGVVYRRKVWRIRNADLNFKRARFLAWHDVARKARQDRLWRAAAVLQAVIKGVMVRLWAGRELKKQRIINLQRRAAAEQIQRVARGLVARRRVAYQRTMLAAVAHSQYLGAQAMQKVYRGWNGRRVAEAEANVWETVEERRREAVATIEYVYKQYAFRAKALRIFRHLRAKAVKIQSLARQIATRERLRYTVVVDK